MSVSWVQWKTNKQWQRRWLPLFNVQGVLGEAFDDIRQAMTKRGGACQKGQTLSSR